MIYEPEEDTFFLLDNISPKGKILEMGAGSGYISKYLRDMGFDITAADIDIEAINILKKEKNIKVVQSDLFSNINEKFDTIIFNPPYLPGTYENDITIFGGDKGQEIIDRFLSQVTDHLNKDGVIFIIFSSFNDIDYLMKKYNSLCFKKMNEKKFSFHSIYVYKLWRCGDAEP